MPTAVATGEEACHAPSALVLLCAERACAFYRCLDVAPLEGDPLGSMVLTRGVGTGMAPAATGSSSRWWGPVQRLPRDAEPVFVIPWRQRSRPVLPPHLESQVQQRARRPHVQHALFPQASQHRAWLARRGINTAGWTVPILVEDYLRIHEGAQGDLWEKAWREFMQAKPNATPEEIWIFAGELCVRFEIFGPVLAGPLPLSPPKVSSEEAVVRFVGLDADAKTRADQALAECANLARAEVLARRMSGRKPTPEECGEHVGRDGQGKPVTRAMQLGQEMHRVALQCAREKLGKVRPGGFSLEPRYRYNLPSGPTIWVSPEEEQLLLHQGLGSKLLGTIVPDVVLHAGDPTKVQEVYDFKFPCVKVEEMPQWRPYPDGHPYGGYSQGTIYKRALVGEPARVAPQIGVIR